MPRSRDPRPESLSDHTTDREYVDITSEPDTDDTTPRRPPSDTRTARRFGRAGVIARYIILLELLTMALSLALKILEVLRLIINAFIRIPFSLHSRLPHRSR